MSLAQKTPDWANRHGYFWHSNPSGPDGPVFFEKAFMRPKRAWAWSVLRGEAEGDMLLAQQIIAQSGHYKDAHGNSIYSDNPAMASGRAVQYYTDEVLVRQTRPYEAYEAASNLLKSYEPMPWRDVAAEKLVIEHRFLDRYDIEGRVTKEGEGTSCEFGLVCANAWSGLTAAAGNDYEIEGECELFGMLPGCELPYYGKPDYGRGRIELKTQWDTSVASGSPRANSLPKEIKANHLTQLAGYWYLSGIVPKIVYSNRLSYAVLEPTQEQLDQALSAIILACKRRERLLKTAGTTEELLQLTDPSFGEGFDWRDRHPAIIEAAKTLWGVTNE